MSAFWDTVPCILVEANRSFRDAYCLHHQSDEFALMTDETTRRCIPQGCIFTLTAVRTWNLMRNVMFSRRWRWLCSGLYRRVECYVDAHVLLLSSGLMAAAIYFSETFVYLPMSLHSVTAHYIVVMVTKLWVPLKAGNFLPSSATISFSRRTKLHRICSLIVSPASKRTSLNPGIGRYRHEKRTPQLTIFIFSPEIGYAPENHKNIISRNSKIILICPGHMLSAIFRFSDTDSWIVCSEKSILYGIVLRRYFRPSDWYMVLRSRLLEQDFISSVFRNVD
jgi:hypothetical protein